MKIAVMLDFDGVLLNAMELHGILAAKCMHKHFKIPVKEAIQKYHSTTGIPFPKQLEKIFPKADPKKRNQCATEYIKRKVKEVFYKARLFPEIKETLDKLTKLDFTLIVSSATEATLVNKLLEKHKVKDYFKFVFGEESGTKQDHINRVANELKPDLIIFVDDSPGEMKLKRVLIIGRAGDPKSGMHSVSELKRAGADYVVSGLREVIPILQKWRRKRSIPKVI